MDTEWATEDDRADFPVCRICGEAFDKCPNRRPNKATAEARHAHDDHSQCDPDFCLVAEDEAEASWEAWLRLGDDGPDEY